MTFLPSISLAMEFSTLLLLLACLLFTVTVIEGKSNYAHADLECYMGRNPVGYRPNVLNVCHRYRFHQTPQCLKFTQGSVVTRDCDPSFLCERFNVRNRCIKDLGQANLFGEICCCSTDLCNASNNISLSFSVILISIVVIGMLR